MNNISLLYNNSVLSLTDFINYILQENNNLLSIHEIDEQNHFYYITINNFLPSIHTFQLFYKHKFLIVQVKERKSQKILLTRIYFLFPINISNISHVYYNNSVKIKIEKSII